MAFSSRDFAGRGRFRVRRLLRLADFPRSAKPDGQCVFLLRPDAGTIGNEGFQRNMGKSEPTAASEEDLLARAQAGDEEAFAELFGRHTGIVAGRIRRVLPARITRKVSVADVVQEVRITAFQRIKDFELRGVNSFRNWLMRIAELKVGSELKRYGQAAKRAAHAEVTRGQRLATGQFLARDPSPSAIAIASESRRFVREALALVPDDYRCILELVYVEQLNLREAGERMGRSADAARKLYGRALTRFTEVCKQMRGSGHA